MKNCCKCNHPLDREDYYGLHKKCFSNWFNLTEISHFSDIIPRSQSLMPFDSRENKSFFHGAFKKYSSQLGQNHYILKVIQDEHPELPVTEFVCNQIYETLNIEVPPFYLLRFPDDQLCFVTKNFMSSFSNSSLEHIYHYLKSKDEHNCERLVAVIGEETGRRTEQERFAFLTLADSLIGNHDRHGRNIGFIKSPKGMFLAPFYDNPSYVGLDNDSMLGADLQPRGAIFTKATNEPKMKDYIVEWRRLGYTNIVEKFQKTVSIKKLINIIEESLLSPKRKKALIRLISKRYEELCES